GVHEATETFEIGNPFLTKEKANSAELGFKKADGPLRFDSSFYYTRYDSFIFKQLTGVGCGETLADCGVEDELDQVVFQQRKATFYGFEIAAQYDVAPIWKGVWGVDGQYDFVRAKFEGDNVPRIPPHRLGGGLYYRDANLFARVGVLHAFEQDDVNAESNEATTPSYTLINAELSYTTKLSNPTSGPSTEITIGIKGENLADEEVLNHSSFKRREDVLLPGASVKVFGKLKFN
ncbi:MAG: TonB-dependent receptor, partial [Pseudomonadota bacterium]